MGPENHGCHPESEIGGDPNVREKSECRPKSENVENPKLNPNPAKTDPESGPGAHGAQGALSGTPWGGVTPYQIGPFSPPTGGEGGKFPRFQSGVM